MPDPKTPKFKVPFEIRNGRARTVEQGSTEEVVQCVSAIIRTPIGTHMDDPELGIPDPSFGGATFEEVDSAIREGEPRAGFLLSPEDISELYEQHVNIYTEEEGAA